MKKQSELEKQAKTLEERISFYNLMIPAQQDGYKKIPLVTVAVAEAALEKRDKELEYWKKRSLQLARMENRKSQKLLELKAEFKKANKCAKIFVERAEKLETAVQSAEAKHKEMMRLIDVNKDYQKEIQKLKGEKEDEFARLSRLVNFLTDRKIKLEGQVADANQMIKDLNEKCKYKRQVAEAQKIFKEIIEKLNKLRNTAKNKANIGGSEYTYYHGEVKALKICLKEFERLGVALGEKQKTDYGFPKLPNSLLQASKEQKTDNGEVKPK